MRVLKSGTRSLKEPFTGKMLIGQWQDVELRPNRLWVIVSPLIWVRPNGSRINISPYLITDYASIPEMFWWLLPKRNVYYDVAAAFHDDCVRNRKRRNMSFMDCHEVFKEIMKHYKTPKWQYELMYIVVTLAGPFLKTNGWGSLPPSIQLTQEEKEKYQQIKDTFSWNDSHNLVNINIHASDSFCM